MPTNANQQLCIKPTGFLVDFAMDLKIKVDSMPTYLLACGLYTDPHIHL